jgi:hypothetical protein
MGVQRSGPCKRLREAGKLDLEDILGAFVKEEGKEEYGVQHDESLEEIVPVVSSLISSAKASHSMASTSATTTPSLASIVASGSSGPEPVLSTPSIPPTASNPLEPDVYTSASWTLNYTDATKWAGAHAASGYPALLYMRYDLRGPGPVLSGVWGGLACNVVVVGLKWYRKRVRGREKKTK